MIFGSLVIFANIFMSRSYEMVVKYEYNAIHNNKQNK